MNQTLASKCLLILGCGYVGKKLAQSCLIHGIRVKATVRHSEQITPLKHLGVEVVQTADPSSLDATWLQDCNLLLDSIPLSYDDQGAPYQSQSSWLTPLLDKMPQLAWAGYLSSISVYANSNGAWIDETMPANATSPRGAERIIAENTWLNSLVPAEIFRLAGIYGNERNIIAKLMAGNYKTIQWQPEHYSNRIHVDDIITTLMAAMSSPLAGRILNVCDDEPSPHATYASGLAQLVGAPAPIVLTPTEAKAQLSEKFISFFSDSKRISNQKLHQQLVPSLKYPSFKSAASSLQQVQKS